MTRTAMKDFFILLLPDNTKGTIEWKFLILSKRFGLLVTYERRSKWSIDAIKGDIIKKLGHKALSLVINNKVLLLVIKIKKNSHLSKGHQFCHQVMSFVIKSTYWSSLTSYWSSWPLIGHFTIILHWRNSIILKKCHWQTDMCIPTEAIASNYIAFIKIKNIFYSWALTKYTSLTIYALKIKNVFSE